MLLACSCFWICSCGDVSNSSSEDANSTESSVEISESESNSENTSEISESESNFENNSEDSSSDDSTNGGNWTEEMPLD